LHFDLRPVFASGRGHCGGVSLFREQGRRHFVKREVTLIARLTPISPSA
jgi:hypothetical protein